MSRLKMLSMFPKVFFNKNMNPADENLNLPETHLKDYTDILSRRRWIIIAFCVLSTLSVAVASFMMTPLYKASATIVVESEDADMLNPSAGSGKGMSFDIFENYLATQMSLIMSRSIAGKVFEDLQLANTPRYQAQPSPLKLYVHKKVRELKKIFSGDLGSQQARKSDPLVLFLKDIELERLKGTRAIKISVYNPDAQLAAQIANGLAERYSRDNLARRAMTFIRNQRMASLNADYLRLQSKYDYLSNQYGYKHHEMIALRTEIEALSKRINDEKSKGIKEEATEYPLGNTSKEEEEKLLGKILEQIQESSVFSSSQMNNIAIADLAVAPTEVAVPHKSRNILIGFLAGLIVGIFLAFFVEYLDDTIKTEDDLKRVLGDKNAYMGVIPFDRHIKGFRRISNLDRLMAQRPLSASAEAYRLLRIQLHWFMKKKTDFKDFAMVSSIPGEGKSTIASNLAISLAQLDMKILLVDADIRRGRLSRTYNIGKKKGLCQYLSEDVSLEEVIQKTKIPNLSVITPGESAIMGSELLSSSKMKELIYLSRKFFDLVVYDTPPITLISDTSILLSHLGGAILVTRTGVTRSKIILKSLSMIHRSNTSLIGVVLNGSVVTEDKYYHLYYKEKGLRMNPEKVGMA